MTARKALLILCFFPFPQGFAAKQQLKCEQYFPDWRLAGYDITVASFTDRSIYDIAYEPSRLPAKPLGTLRRHLRRLRDFSKIGRFDLVYVFMWVTPFGTSLIERLTRALAKRLVYDIEDNALVGQSIPKEYNPNLLVRLLKGRGNSEYQIGQVGLDNIHCGNRPPFWVACRTRAAQA